MASHSSVNYIEPNLSAASNEGIVSWKVQDDYERAPRLEDYCITVNLEVEVCSRNNISANNKITSDVLILSYKTNVSGDSASINFMGGTKIVCNDSKNTTIPYLTTNYADMYVGDLIDYGTTELIGIKSIDVDYQKSCVPIITIKFTDVRGLSLFQPTELSRGTTYEGIKGLNSENIAQSFFQCFFRVPMPKFTITIKGFYGKPVTYEVMCDKFDTQFNSETGDFDLTTRFIGYSYSFLTDISIDALLAAPYSDYIGEQYWKREIQNRFQLPSKDGTVKKPMPTLVEIYLEIRNILKRDDFNLDTAISDEEATHTNEISALQDIQVRYEAWFISLYDLCCQRYGKERCFLFKDNKNDDLYNRIVVLTTPKSAIVKDLSGEYSTFPKAFKKIHEDLYTAIEKYNADGFSSVKLPNISKDFSKYLRVNIFNKLFINGQGNIVFNGFNKNCPLPQTEVVQEIFNGIDYDVEEITIEEVKGKEKQHKNFVLSTIYNDGNNQYIDGFNIHQDYSFIKKRINQLQIDANKSTEELTHEKKIKALNEQILQNMDWYPSVENFSKIMMAHLETLMAMMYQVVSNSEGRTATELGVTTGPDGICCDVNNKNEIIPPFPRVTKNIIGDDGIIKHEDTWVGEYTMGTKGFEEVDFINGLFNGVERFMARIKDSNTINQEIERRESLTEDVNSPQFAIKYPVSSFDFFISKSPYGNSDEISNDKLGYQFAGKVAIRMFDILAINHFRNEFNLSTEMIKNLGTIEADNFYELVNITNDQFLSMIRSGELNTSRVIDIITSSNDISDCPWGVLSLFTYSRTNMWLNRYTVNPNHEKLKNDIYPIQDINFNQLEKTWKVWQQGKITSSNGSISVWNVPNVSNELNLYQTQHSNYGLGNVVLYDSSKNFKDYITNCNTDTGSTYYSIYKNIESASTFVAADYESFFTNIGTIPSFCTILNSTNTSKAFTISKHSKLIEIDGLIYNNEIMAGLGDEADGGAITNYTITEAFGINGNCSLNMNASFSTDRPNILPADFDKNVGNCMCALFCFNLNYGTLSKYSNKTIMYLPKIIVLQIGILSILGGGINNFTSSQDKLKKNAIANGLPLYGSSRFNPLIKFVANMSKPARLQYMQYAYNWIRNNTIGRKVAYIITNATNLIYPQNSAIKRRLLNQNSAEVKSLTNELLKPVLNIKLSVTYQYNQTKSKYAITESQATAYLDSFFERLKQLYRIGYTENSEGNLVQIAETPKKTTNDMKKELYRYMKQVYDKWIPMSSFKDWQVESFFIDEDGGEKQGHKFYFIDSYYNSIAQKLLINPQILSEKLDALFQYRDINAMMLGFMADIYSANKCMLMCIQNFADLKKPHSMDETFTPLAYNSIDWKNLNKYSSFVVLYPYEPSKFLNIPNSEYNNDSFMLNDENETPIAIRSKTNKEGQYMIPAFGVTYGKQYQSYFKRVNINMQSPIATQQSIQAKHYILQSNGSAKEKGVAAQDLYDIYSTQSYTCEVEMMGCAWIQPLMYFVLLNIPMFRGSYMIFKVHHSIQPGNMTTTFSGCRMANVSNKIVEDIFTDSDSLDDSLSYSSETLRQKKADIDNNCEYKAYPLYEENLSGAKWKTDEQGPKFSSETAWATAMFHAYLSAGASITIAKIIVAQDCLECGWGKKQAERFNMGGIICHNGQKTNSGYQAYNSIAEYVSDKKRQLQKNFPGAWESTTWKDYFDIIQNRNGKNPKGYKYAEDSAYVTKVMGEDGNGGTYKSVCQRLKNVATIPDNINEISSSKKSINEALYDAIQKTANSTPSLNIELSYQEINSYGVITQKYGERTKLANVFDMILSTYGQYIQKIYWVYPTNGITSEPVHIDYIASISPKISEQYVRVAESGKISATETNEIPKDSNKQLLQALGKLRQSINKDSVFLKEVPQIRDITILDNYKPQDCSSLFTSNIGGSNFYVPSTIHNVGCPNPNGLINAATNYLKTHAKSHSIEKCWAYVKRGLIKGGLPPTDIIPAADASPYLEKNGFKCIYAGYNDGHKGTNYGQPCLGDITVFEKTPKHDYGHIDMWCGNAWISDFIQNGNWVSGSYKGRFTVWRYQG